LGKQGKKERRKPKLPRPQSILTLSFASRYSRAARSSERLYLAAIAVVQRPESQVQRNKKKGTSSLASQATRVQILATLRQLGFSYCHPLSAC